MTIGRSATTDHILDAAERRVRRGGLAAASFRDLAGDVGITSASVHYHFPQKADLARALVERYAVCFIDGLGPATSGDALDRLIAAYRDSLASDGAACLCAILGATARDLPEPAAAAVADFYAALVAWATPTLCSTEAAEFAVATLQGAMILAVAQRDPGVLARAANRLRRALSKP